jgi:Flp pilus assembly protein CpaB
MRPRTFLLIILILLVAAAAVVIFLVAGGDSTLAGLLPGGNNGPETVPVDDGGDDGVADETAPPAQPEPEANFVDVVVAARDVPVGARFTREVLRLEARPEDNVAVRAQYTFSDFNDIVGRIARVDIAQGQAVLNSMVALSPNDIAAMGSDLALYVNQGSVGVALPIDRYSGAAYAMRPGDLVDVLMTLNFVAIDPEFQTALPNLERRVNQFNLEEGTAFLFEPVAQGRLELLPTINLVATIAPGGIEGWDPGEELLQVPRRATQLTVQQAEVLWVGTWQDPQQLADEARAEYQREVEQAEAQGQPPPPAPDLEAATFERRENRPDAVILSMSPQDALSLKWALDRGVNLDLALRAQGDNSVFLTTAVSLPQMVEQGGLTIPDRGDFDLTPRADDVPQPSLPPNPPGP